MIKRVFWVGLYTGLAHLISLITISFVLRNLGEEVSGYMGVVDSYVLIISVVTSFGIQLSVNRNIAIQKNWVSSFVLAQRARLTLSLGVLAFGFISYFYNWDLTKWIIFAAPFIALNGDYSLYGQGKPIDGARLSFFRVAIPNIAVLISSQFIGADSIYFYIIFFAVGIINSGFFASRINKLPYFYKPYDKFYKVYIKNVKVGIFQLSYIAMITGILAITKSFYSIAIIGLVYGILKYFEIFKGVLRIIIQSFFREFTLKDTSLRIDKAGILIGSFILIPTIIFPDSTLNFIYADTYDGIELLFSIFGISMFIAGLKTSADMQLMIEKKDTTNLVAYVSAFIITIGTAIFISYTEYNIYGIGIGILAGEVTLLLILGFSVNGFTFFKDRLIFFLKLSPVLIIISGIRYFFGESIYALLISIALYIVWVFGFYKKLIFDSSFLINEGKNG